MAHLVGDDVVQCAVGLHPFQVGRVEGHRAGRGKKCRGSGLFWPKSARAGRAKDVSWAVNWAALGRDHDIVDEFAADQHVR
jgi:hypothetical protein